MVEATAREHLDLPDGTVICFEIRPSTKARTLRLKISARDGLVVTTPKSLDRERVLRLVAGKVDWIAARMSELDAVRHLVTEPTPTRPQAFDLPALSEAWLVEYKATSRRTVGAQTDQLGRIVVFGAIGDVVACQAALRRWLARHAAQTLPGWLSSLAGQSGLRFTDLTIKYQRTRWGSCALHGRISLNCKLLFLPRELVRYVMVHELCHLLEPNHSERFWAHVRRIEPTADHLHDQMRDAWKLVPKWAQRGHGLML